MISNRQVKDWMDEAAKTGEPVDLTTLNPEDLTDLMSKAEWYRQALGAVIGEAKHQLTLELGDGGYVKRAGMVYRVKPERSWKVRDGQRTRFFQVLHGAGWEAIDRAFNPNGARVGELRELLADVADPETGELGLDQFVEWTTGDMTVTVQPVDNKYVPLFLQKADDGVKYGRRHEG